MHAQVSYSLRFLCTKHTRLSRQMDHDMLSTTHRPATLRTPVDFLAALTLSPRPEHQPERRSLMTFPSFTFTVSPPSPTATEEVSPAAQEAAPDTPDEPSLVTAPPAAVQRRPSHRSLTPAEARQLTLLLTQELNPVRSSPKSLMGECIVLAEKLHEAGVRWDKHRRVMGMHLRGIWEEGCRWTGSGDEPAQHQSME